MPRSFLVNAVDVALAADVATPDVQIVVDDATELPPVPFYLVISPFGDTTREYLLCTAVATNTLSVTRNLAGSQSTTHLTGDLVRITFTAQHLDDLWDETESHIQFPAGGVLGDTMRKLSAVDGDVEFRAFVSTQAGAPGTPLPGDLWIDTSLENRLNFWNGSAFEEVNQGFLPLAGGTMLGDLDMGFNFLYNLPNPTNPGDAASKSYVDGVVQPPQTFLHDDLTDVTASQHHARYTDAEAISAVGDPGAGVYLPLSGGAMTGNQALGVKLVRNITVSSVQPGSPVQGDVWFDIS